MLDEMIALAAHLHSGQFDKAGKPYILHPLAVMRILNSDDDELNCIAVGHDVLEDTDMTVRILEDHGYSDRVLKGIEALTKFKGMSKEDYLAQICANEDAIRVKMADIRHNSDFTRLKGVTKKDLKRMKKYMVMYTHLENALVKD